MLNGSKISRDEILSTARKSTPGFKREGCRGDSRHSIHNVSTVHRC
jgi:hypothetical protein